MDEKVKIKIFLASPMDLSDERLTVKSLIEDVTQKEGAESGFELELIGWEDHTAPAFGVDAQDVVNEQILEYDVIVCLFKERLGTPTKRAASGTVEEYERAKLKRLYNKNLRIMAYFIEHPSPQPGIGDLKRKMGNEGALYWDVKATDDFSALVRKHLISVSEDYLKLYREQKLSDTNSRPRNSSYLAIVYEPEFQDDGEPEVLILQRSLKSKTGPGQWQLPGGKSEEGETPKETAIREVREETGLDLSEYEDEITQIHVFTSALNEDPADPYNITLFIYKTNEKYKPKLDTESMAHAWFSLDLCDFGRKRFFIQNKQMLKAVWRETYVTSALRYIQSAVSLEEFGTDAEEIELPTEYIDQKALNRAYSLLSLLGIVDVEGGISFTSRYGKKLLEEVIDTLSGGESIFRNDGNALPSRGKSLSYDSIEQLTNVRANAFCSHSHLVAHLSCDTTLTNESRDVCDLVAFGSFNEKNYILLRWDFFANKYQLVAKGLEQAQLNKERDMIDFVLNSRFPSYIKEYMYAILVTKYDSDHFSAGSVNNDPIWRKYHINLGVLMPRDFGKVNEILEAIDYVNRSSEEMIDTALTIDTPTAKKLNYFVWCDLEELISSPGTYRGKKVSGFGDLKRNLGEAQLRTLANSPLALMPMSDGFATDDRMNEYKAKFDAKRSF